MNNSTINTKYLLSSISSRDRINSLVMLSRAPKNGSCLCIKPSFDTEKTLSQMTFKDKKKHIIKEVYCKPKCPDNTFVPNVLHLNL